MVRSGAISGRVSSPGGGVYPGALGLVVLEQLQFDDFGRKRLAPVNASNSATAVSSGSVVNSTVRMDDRGEYRFFGLRPGDYFIRANGQGAAAYYPGVTDERSAVAVHVGAGEEIRLEAIVLAPRSAGVPVNVRFDRDYPSSTKTVVGISPNVRILKPQNDRALTIGDVAPGHYEDVLVYWASNTDLFYSRFTVDVANKEVTKDIPVRRGARVSSKISLQEADGALSAASASCLRLRSISGTGAALADVVPASGMRGLGPGSCLDQSVEPGAYHFDLRSSPPDAYVSSVVTEARVEDNFIYIAGDTVVGVILASPGGILRGTVQNAQGTRLSAAVVAVIPASPMPARSLAYRSVETNADGTFEIRGIPPGMFEVFAWRELPGVAFLNEDFMKAFEGLGKTIRVEQNSEQLMDLIGL